VGQYGLVLIAAPSAAVGRVRGPVTGFWYQGECFWADVRDAVALRSLGFVEVLDD
jgi:hypothetical protein